MSAKSIKIFINYIIGTVLFVWLSFSIYHQILQQKDLYPTWKNITASFNINEWLMVAASVFLMLMNWGLEAYKWQLLVKGIEKVSFAKAFRAVFTGQALAFGTFNGVGDFVGRGMYMNAGNRIRSVAVTMVGSLSQTIATIAFGMIGLFYLRFFFPERINLLSGLSSFWMDGLLYILAIITIFIFIVYFNLSFVTKLVEKIPFVSKYVYFIQNVEDFHRKELTTILNFSFVRYIIFILQYLLLLHVFKVNANWWHEVWLISIMFLMLTIVPSMALAELGLRGKLSIALLGLISDNIIGIVFTSAGIWVVNKVIPALAGSLFILGIKFFKKESNHS
jgi:hypothetical protein